MKTPIARIGLGLFALAFAAGCAHTPPSDPSDPFESVNRGIYQFNDTLDRYVLRPTAVGYRNVTPDPVEHSVGNFFTNLAYPVTIVNNYLQAKFHNGTTGVARFVVNTTIGFGGLFDVATGLGLKEHDEDFGQTLGYWGLGQGPYIMLPLLGPTTGRDGVGRIADGFANPLSYVDSLAVQFSLRALELLDLRAGLLGFDKTVRDAFDPYLFIRGAYLEDRLSKVHDGNPPRERLEPSYDDYPSE